MALKEEKEANSQISLDLSDEDGSPEAALLRLDPFARIARLAGFSDSERWWEAVIERSAVDENAGVWAIFQTILDLMRALRDDKALAGRAESQETLLREAQMRQIIRAAQKEGFRRIAVVCGAWHGPALADVGSIKAVADAALLKGLKKIKTEATWIPWSFDRLSTASGYAAGVTAPAWYRLLFAQPEQAATTWLTQAARLLREQDMSTSSAHVIEAIRLAETLAILRYTAQPGIEELREAAVTVLTEGAEKPLELIERILVIGEVLGEVPDTVPTVPLKADFEASVKRLRLEKSTLETLLELDMRKEAHLEKSRFLHRINLLGLQWGKEKAVAGKKQGRFHENWQLHWLPDFEIKIIEAGTWGNTVEVAATQIAQQKIQNTTALSDLVTLLGTVLKADLSNLLPNLLQKLQSITALSTDTLLLSETVLPLAEVLRYGHAREMNLGAIEQLLQQIVPRVCVQFAGTCAGINEEVAESALKTMLSFNRALALLRDPMFDDLWHRALADLAHVPGIAPILAGLATRMLFDKTLETPEQTGGTMRLHVSHAVEARLGGAWLEGFLHGSGLLLLHHPALWQILDEWVCQIDAEVFREMLPLLRRTFSKFPAPEREKMLNLAKNGAFTAPKDSVEWTIEGERAAAVLPILRLLWGLGD